MVGTGAFLLAVVGIPLAMYLLAPLGVKASDYDG